jgi:hypothetical protein
MKYIINLFFLVLCINASTNAQTDLKKGSVADVSFIQGHWKVKTADGQSIEAVWLAPENGYWPTNSKRKVSYRW